MDALIEVAIIGLGSWGLCALERIIDAGRRVPSRAISVHVVEPGRPGGGLYSHAGPDYLILNTPCGQHSMYPDPERVGEDRLGKSFYEWVVERGYRWHGHECRISTTGQAISPHDFLPRRLMGEYLEWFYQALLMEAPPNVSVVHHKTSALDIEATPYGRESVHTDNGDRIDVDHVILTLGHTQEAAARAEVGALATSPYPVERYLVTVSPREKVAIEGMGLVALDAVAALTVGLGGRFTTEQSGIDLSTDFHPSTRRASSAVCGFWCRDRRCPVLHALHTLAEEPCPSLRGCGDLRKRDSWGGQLTLLLKQPTAPPAAHIRST